MATRNRRNGPPLAPIEVPAPPEVAPVAPVAVAPVVESLVTPNALARALTVALGRDVTAKSVRNWARDNMERFDKTLHPAYQSHAYSTDEVAVIYAGFVARTQRASAQAPTVTLPVLPAAPAPAPVVLPVATVATVKSEPVA